MPDGPRYDDDFYAWTKYQADVLREMRSDDNRFDRDNLAEEIEALGNTQRDAVRSQVRRVLEHFLKLAYSPASGPRYGWMGSIVEARAALSDQISATLRQDVEAAIGVLFRDARRRAGLGLLEYGENAAADALPRTCPYTLDDILRDDWYPDPPEPPK